MRTGRLAAVLFASALLLACSGKDEQPPDCTPSCDGRACGDDGCGGACGSCADGQTCNAEGQCQDDVCAPVCDGKECGPDGCDGTCGACGDGQSCSAQGQCVDDVCTPACDGKECGPDGCDDVCGTCGDGQSCSDEGLCVDDFGFRWVRRFGDVTDDGPRSVAADSAGNIVLGGTFDGTVDFGSGPATSSGRDAFVAEFDAAGNTLWSHSFVGEGDEVVEAVTFDSQGNVLIAGHFDIDIELDPVDGPLSAGGGRSDIFMAKFDADGLFVWSRWFGGNSDDYPYSLETDSEDGVILAGDVYSDDLDLGGGALPGAGGSDIFLAKFDSNGASIWSSRFGGADDDQGYAVAATDDDGVVLVGGFRGTVDFGGGGLTAEGGADAFLAKFDGEGAFVWSEPFGSGGGDQTATAVAVDQQGDLFVSGRFQSGIDFGDGALASAGGDDIFLTKLDASGSALWSAAFGAADDDQALGVGVDPLGNVWIFGDFIDSVDFGGGEFTATVHHDDFLAEYDSAGAWVRSYQLGGPGSEGAHAMCVDGEGSVIAAGTFNETVDFGGGDVTSAGADDIFLVKFGP